MTRRNQNKALRKTEAVNTKRREKKKKMEELGIKTGKAFKRFKIKERNNK